MPTTFPFSEERIRKLKPPVGKDREYHKDKTHSGLQCCVTSAGSKTYYLVKRTDGRPTRHLLGTADELSVDQARKAAAAKAGKIATGENPQADRRRKREEPTLVKLHTHWMLYATAGLTPFVWRRSQGGPGLDNYSQAQNTLAYLGEVGALYAATPKFSMGGALNFQWFSSSGVFDAQPSVSLTFVMRFYFSIFGIGQDGPTQGDPLEYRGWRYIGK